LPPLEKAGLLVKDVEILPMHYAHTLRHWRQRFVARKAEAVALYDENFFRMWEFYLAGSEMGFRWDELFIMQIQIAKNQFAVPDNRNYIGEREAKLTEIRDRLVQRLTNLGFDVSLNSTPMTQNAAGTHPALTEKPLEH